jgi:hypothetical protein
MEIRREIARRFSQNPHVVLGWLGAGAFASRDLLSAIEDLIGFTR